MPSVSVLELKKKVLVWLVLGVGGWYQDSRYVISRKATVAHSVLSPSLNLFALTPTRQQLNTLGITLHAVDGAIVNSDLAISAEDLEIQDCGHTTGHDNAYDDDQQIRGLLRCARSSFPP